MSSMNGQPFLAYRPGMSIPTLKVPKSMYNMQELIEAVRIAKAKGLIREPDPVPEPAITRKIVRGFTLYNLTCKKCKAPFQSKLKGTQFCSKPCRNSKNKENERKKQEAERHKRRRTPICGICSKRYETFRLQSVYCDECRALPNFSTIYHRISKERCRNRKLNKIKNNIK